MTASRERNFADPTQCNICGDYIVKDWKSNALDHWHESLEEPFATSAIKCAKATPMVSTIWKVTTGFLISISLTANAMSVPFPTMWNSTSVSGCPQHGNWIKLRVRCDLVSTASSDSSTGLQQMRLRWITWAHRVWACSRIWMPSFHIQEIRNISSEKGV